MSLLLQGFCFCLIVLVLKSWFAKYWFPAKSINEITHSEKKRNYANPLPAVKNLPAIRIQALDICQGTLTANLAHFASYVSGVGTPGKA